MAEAAELPTPEPLTIDQLVDAAAAKYHVNREKLYKTLDCESEHFKDPKIQSGYLRQDGKQERSFGFAQFNLDAHPEITYEEATDPAWAIDEMAKWWSEGRAGEWSCYRKLAQ